MIKALPVFLAVALICTSCSQKFQPVVGPNGVKRMVPTPQKFILFQDTTVVVKGVTVPYAGKDISIGEVTFGRTFKTAADIAAILDNAQYRDSSNLALAASVLTDEQFTAQLAKLTESQQKIDQLALIASSKDAAALQKWLDIYFEKENSSYVVANQKPVTNTTLGLHK